MYCHVFFGTQCIYVITVIVVVRVFLQAEVSSVVEKAAANVIQFPVEVTGANMRPIVKLQKINSSR